MMVPAPLMRRLRRPADSLPAAYAPSASPWLGAWDVVTVPDGDDIVVKQGIRYAHVRLWGADAPEQGQPVAAVARWWLSDFVSVNPVTLYRRGSASYGRIVCQVFNSSGQDVALLLLAKGLAWYSSWYAPGQTAYADAQQYARLYRLGIWADCQPVAPWTFRARWKGQ